MQHDDPTEQALVARLQALSTELAAAPDPQYRAATRQRLVAMAAVQAPGTAGRRPPARVGVLRRVLAGSTSSRRRSRLTAGLAGAALTVTALGGLLAAAQGARPGDLLHDLKRGGEQTQLSRARRRPARCLRPAHRPPASPCPVHRAPPPPRPLGRPPLDRGPTDRRAAHPHRSRPARAGTPPLPGLPSAPTSAGPVVPVPPLVPGVQVCAPPLITVGC